MIKIDADKKHTPCDICEFKQKCIDDGKIEPLVLELAREEHWILGIGTICDRWIKEKRGVN
jgi:hypothetical protein